MYEEIKSIDKIEILKNGTIQIREAIQVMNDGAEVAKNYHRYSFNMGDDVSAMSTEIQTLIALAWTGGFCSTEEVTNSSEAIKEALILKASLACTERIYAGFDSACLGEIKHFDCQMYDQTNIMGLAITAMLGLQGLTTEECHWKASGELECYKFEYAQVIQLAVDMKKHIQAQTDQFNAERIAILNSEV